VQSDLDEFPTARGSAAVGVEAGEACADYGHATETSFAAVGCVLGVPA